MAGGGNDTLDYLEWSAGSGLCANAADQLRANSDSQRDTKPPNRKSTLPAKIQYKIQGRTPRRKPIAYLSYGLQA